MSCLCAIYEGGGDIGVRVGGHWLHLDATTATDGGGVNETVIITLCVLVWQMERG